MLISQLDAQNIVTEMKRLLHHDINIMDEQGIIVASTDAARLGEVHQGAVRVLREGLESLTIWRNVPEEGVRHGVNLPMILGGKAVGVIGITGSPDRVSVFGDVIRRMTELMMENIQNKEQAILLAQARSLFLENWLFAEQPDWAELDMRGRLLGLDIHAPYTVAMLRLGEKDREGSPHPEEMRELRSGQALQLVQKQLGNTGNHYCTMIKNHIVLFLCKLRKQEVCSLVRNICGDIRGAYPVSVFAGVSTPTREPADLRRRYLEAMIAMKACGEGGTREITVYDETSLDFIVQSIPASVRGDLQRLVFSACTEREQEEFRKIIRVFFQCNGDMKLCGERMYVHRNTVQYHIDRIFQKTGYDLRAPGGAMLLYLAC